MKLYLLIVSLLIIPQSCVVAHTKKSFNKFFDTVVSKFKRSKEDIIQKNFTDIQRIELLNTSGDIIITSWKQKTVAIEIIKKVYDETTEKVQVQCHPVEGILQIKTILTDPKIQGEVTYNILTPQNTELKIATKDGNIIIKDIQETIDAYTKYGFIKVRNSQKTTKLISEHGNISFKSNHIKKSSDINISTEKGNITLYLAQDIHLLIDAFAPHGKVTSEVPILLNKKLTTLNPQAWKLFKQEAKGTIGQPDATLSATTHNGSITILPYVKSYDCL